MYMSSLAKTVCVCSSIGKFTVAMFRQTYEFRSQFFIDAEVQGPKDCFWPEACDRRGCPKLSIIDSSKPASDCVRSLDRNGALGQKQSFGFRLSVSAKD